MVPNGWKFENLEDLEGSQRPVVKAGPFGSSLKKEFYTKTGYKVYGQEQVIANDAFYGDYYIDEQRYQLLKSCAVEPDDILISLVGTIGKVLLVPNNAQPGVINPRLLRISLNKTQMSSKFFKYFLESRPTVNLLDRWAQGGTMGVLNAATLKALIVPVPPLPEQQKIANILSTWDKAIGTTERLIDNSTQQKKALMQQLLTGKKRLLDDAGQRFAGDWEEGSLANFAKIKKGKALSSKDLKDGSYPVIAGGKSSPYSHSDFTHENIITVSASGAYAGYIAFFPYKIWASDCSVVEPKDDNNIKYLYYWLTHHQQRIYTLQSGGAQPHIYPRDLDSMKILMPNSKEQRKIATVLTNADQEIDLLTQQLADLQQEKKALMQVLLTGKKRVVVD